MGAGVVAEKGEAVTRDEKIEDLQNIVDSIVVLQKVKRANVKIDNRWGLAATFTQQRKILISPEVLSWSENARYGVVAHELAHVFLKHHRSTASRNEREFEADQLAVSLLDSIGLKGEKCIIAGFDETPIGWQDGFDDRRRQLRDRNRLGGRVTG